jgi:hypothetical protein
VFCSPTWDTIKIPLVTLSGGDVYRPLLIEVFGYNKKGAHTLWGSTRASVDDFTNPGKTFQLQVQYNSSVHHDCSSNSNRTNHAIIIVGYAAHYQYSFE